MITEICIGLMIAGSEPAGPTDKPDSYLEPAGHVFGETYALATADTDYIIQTVGDAAQTGVNLCIPYGSQMYLMMEGGSGVCTWTQTASLSYDNAASGAAECEVTDTAGPDGPGACFRLIDSVPVNEVPTHRQMQHVLIGRRPGVCSSKKSFLPTLPNIQVLPPCGVDGDCSHASAWNISGGTCDTSLSSFDVRMQEEFGCVALVCQADTNGTLLHIGIQK